MTERLSCMPGIAHFLQVDEYPLGDFDDILAKCKLHYGDALAGKIFSVRCKRAGKHPFSSMDVERSEEHTSELQSLMRISYAVFCLKKKKNIKQTSTKVHQQR